MEEESRKETILLVDDTPSTIELVKTALEEEGYEVFVATSGDKALKRAERAMPALILLDVRMPVVGRVKYMERLIDGILRYSRVGRIAEAEEPIDLHHLVNGVIELIAPPESVRITIEQELPHITGDSLRIQEVFQNLLSNAIKFMDKPEGRITIGCVDEGTHWTFRIADNGPGIPPERYEDIFPSSDA